MNVYETIPLLEGKNYLLRGILPADLEELFTVYSDEKAVPLFNGDNCHGDDFHYTTLSRMQEAMDFWQFSYDNRYFVRWAVVEKASGRTVGAVECFHRDCEEEDYDNCALLRLDLRSDHETEEAVTDALLLAKKYFYDLFDGDKIVTKIGLDGVRKRTAEALGFVKPQKGMPLNNGDIADDYYILRKA